MVEDAFAQGCAKVGGIRERLAVSRSRVSNAVGLAISPPESSRCARGNVSRDGIDKRKYIFPSFDEL